MIGKLLAGAAALAWGCTASHQAAASGAADFYTGRTINLIVGFAPGSGYDMVARIVSRHLGAHVPGKPNVIVQNMTGAGGVRAANYVYSVAAKDGLTVAEVNQGAAMFKLLDGEGAQYDPTKLHWLGSVSTSNNVAYTWIETSGVRTIEDATRKEVLIGGSGIISDSTIYAKILNEIAGTRFKLINGYTGGANETNVAIERGELHGRAGGSYAGLLAQRPAWVKDGKIAILSQVGIEKEAALPHVPLLTELAKTEEHRQIAALVTTPVAFGYNYWIAPEVPAERVKALRDALMAMTKDAAFIADMGKGGFEVRPRSGEELQRMVNEAAALPAPVLAKTKAILGW